MCFYYRHSQDETPEETVSVYLFKRTSSVLASAFKLLSTQPKSKISNTIKTYLVKKDFFIRIHAVVSLFFSF